MRRLGRSAERSPTNVAQRVVAVALATAAAVVSTTYAVHAYDAARSQYSGLIQLPQISLNFTATGRIASVLASAGDHVRKGQVIATLDASAPLAMVRSDRSALAVDRLRLRGALATGRERTILGARAGILHDTRSLQRDEAALARTSLTAPADGVLTAVPAVVGTAVTASGVRVYRGTTSAAAGDVARRELATPPVPRSRQPVSSFEPVALETVDGPSTVVVDVPEATVRAFPRGVTARVSIPAANVTGRPARCVRIDPRPVTYHTGIGYAVEFVVDGALPTSVRDGMSADLTLA